MNHDLAAEKALCLALVTNNVAWDYCGDQLRAEMFSSDQARSVFTAVSALVRACQRVTPEAIQAHMISAGAPGSVVPSWAKAPGGASVESVPVLAARIRDLWGRRELARVAAEAAAAAPDQPATRTADQLSAAVSAVAMAGASPALRVDRIVYDWLNELETESKSGSKPLFVKTGFGKFDHETGGLARGELSVFAARPGNGKSALMVAIACNLAAAGIPVGCFWLEDDRRDFARRVLARMLSLEAWRFRGSARDVLNHVTSHRDFLEKVDLPIHVDDTHAVTMTEIAARMRRMSREHGVRAFILDHLGEVLIERGDRWGDRHDLSLGLVARQYRDTAKALGAVPILVSQMNRRVEQRAADEVPRMSDLDGSGQVEQAARMIAFLQQHRDANGTATGTGALHIVKATGGTPCSVQMRWEGPSMTWREA